MSVEYASRSWVKKQAPLLLGFLITSGACARRDQNTRSVVASGGAEQSGAVEAASELASAARERPNRPEARLLPVNGVLDTHPGEVRSSRSLELGAKGRVFASTRQDENVYALVDDDGDHKVDRVHVMARGLDTLDWITSRDRASPSVQLSPLLGINGLAAPPGRLPKPVVVVTDKLPARQQHGWRYVRFGAGGWLYLPVRITHQA